METDALIARLTREAGPVRRMMAPWKRAACWLALAVPPLVVVIAFEGLAGKAAMSVTDWRFVIEEIAILATAVTAAIAAFASTIPGHDRRWLWIPAAPLAVWLLTVGEGCVSDWMRLGAAGLTVRADFDCFPPMVLIGTLPAVAMIVMLRRGAPIHPRVAFVLGTLATAAVANFGLRLFHVGDISIMVLVWHFGLLAALLSVAAACGPQVLRWKIAVAAPSRKLW